MIQERDSADTSVHKRAMERVQDFDSHYIVERLFRMMRGDPNPSVRSVAFDVIERLLLSCTM